MLRLFVYGTLKRGCENHDRYCNGVLSIVPATIRGKLYELLSGVPIVAVPPRDVLAVGTSDPLTDIATQARVSSSPTSRFESVATTAQAKDWGTVYGELLTFDDPLDRLPLIDDLEDFHPQEPSLYRRVLLPVSRPGSRASQTAWVYVAGIGVVGLSEILTGIWTCHAAYPKGR